MLPKVHMPPVSDDSPDLESLMVKIRDNGNFAHDYLYYENTQFTDDDVVRLADALRTNTSLKGITLRNMDKVGDKGSIALAEALEGNPRIEIIGLANNIMTDASAAAWAKTLRKSQTLRDVTFGKNEMTETGQEQLFAATLESQNPNLISLWTYLTNPPPVKQMLDGNRRNAWNLAEDIIAHPDRLSAEQLRTLDRCAPTVMIQARSQATSLKVEADPETYTPDYADALLGKLPALPPEGASFAEALFTADERGYAPLDNPRLWASTEAAKQSLDRLPHDESTLTKPTLRGGTILDAAVHAIPAEELVGYFNDKGVRFTQKWLLDERQKPTPFFQKLIDSGKAPALFTSSNWSASSSHGMRAAFAHLPEPQQERVGMARLLQDLKQAAPQSQGIGR
ncbi:MAG: hypothetical protein FJX23_10885 [Alphaproteobacteria bacterium]|nr:hypothetical protein [Alphaproteobacteria bacterium]